MNILISNRLTKKDGKCVICHIKHKANDTKTYIDEIYKGKKGLTSSYYMRGISYLYINNPKRIIYNNLNEALEAIKEGRYNKFENLYIRKIKNIYSAKVKKILTFYSIHNII